MKKLIPKKQTAWGKLEYKGPQYSQVIEQMKKEDPQAYNRLQVANARSQQPNSEVVRWKDAEGDQRTSTTNIGMSGTDPIGQLYVEGVALNPVFKGLGRVAEYGLAKAGNKWARARILSRAIDSKSTTYLNNTPQAYKKLSSKQLPKDQSLLYHQNYGTSKLTDKGLIPGKSNNGEDYLWWKEGSQYGNFPERNVYTIPKHRANIITRGNSVGINPNGDYPLTKEVPLEELTEYSINPMTYGFEKRIFIKPNKTKQSVGSYDFFDESNPQNLSPISVKKFFKNDVEKRTHILENPAFISDNDDWYKYELHDFQKGVLGDYTPEIDRVRISRTLDPLTSHTTKVHEFRHKLESRYPLNYWQRNHLDKAYRIFSTKEPRNPESRSLSEKTATNTELRANLYHKFRQLNGREPRDIREMDKFIDNLSKVEIRDALRNINGYGNDYVESILSRIESAKQEGLPKEAIQDGVNAWVENIKQALKYVPAVSGVSLIPKNKNTQPSN